MTAERIGPLTAKAIADLRERVRLLEQREKELRNELFKAQATLDIYEALAVSPPNEPSDG